MFDANEFLVLADDLLATDASSEARQRCVIGRAYYAAFLLTREYLIAQGHKFNRNTVHQDVWNDMASLRSPVRNSISVAGKRLRDWRNSADYDLVYRSDLPKEAKIAVLTAKRLISDLRSLP